MELSLHVDRERCIGSGQCVHWAPGAFEQDDRAIAVVVDPRGAPGHKVLQAVLGCPMQAITVRVGACEIGPDALKDWMQGAHADDPFVTLLGALTGVHEEVRAVLAHAAVGQASDGDVRTVVEHALADERRAYDHIRAAGLADAEVVAACCRMQATIEQALGTPGRDLAAIVDEHLRLEETVLFPAALSTVARRARARSAVGGGGPG